MTSTISYQPFEDLITSLRADGMTEAADVIDHLLHKVAWTTGSELIGELGQRIKCMRKEASAHLSADTEKNMEEGMKMVKVIWPDFPED